VEELRRRLDEERGGAVPAPGAWLGELGPRAPGRERRVAAIGPLEEEPPPNVITIHPGTRMADVERRVIEAALRETRGNRRRAAEMLGIGERTLYRKIKEFRMPEEDFLLG
jgi:DNA-binding NtrC family response regulator